MRNLAPADWIRGLPVSRSIYLITGFGQRTLQKALNFRFVLHQQQPHDLMLMHPCGVSVSSRCVYLFGVCGFATPPGEVALLLVTVAVVVDVASRVGLCLRT